MTWKNKILELIPEEQQLLLIKMLEKAEKQQKTSEKSKKNIALKHP